MNLETAYATVWRRYYWCEDLNHIRSNARGQTPRYNLKTFIRPDAKKAYGLGKKIYQSAFLKPFNYFFGPTLN